MRCVETPALLDEALEAIAVAEFPDVDVTRLRDAIFDVLDACGKVDRGALTRHLRNLGNTRAVRLLEDYPEMPPLALTSNEGREWLTALEQFAADMGLREETRRVREACMGNREDSLDFADGYEARRKLAASRHALRTRSNEAAEQADQV